MSSAAANRRAEPWLGIDMGTSDMCAGLWINGRVEILRNEDGYTNTPAYVLYKSENDIVVGMAAKSAARYAENTIYDIKRLIGRSFNDRDLMNDRQTWPFNVVNGEHDRPQVVINSLEEDGV